MNKKIIFDTAYHQFYILDKGSDGSTSGDFWSKSASLNRLAISDRLLGVKTASYGRIQSEIALLEKEPDIRDLDEFDHVVEVGLNVKSGVIEIADCPSLAVEMRIDVPPGNYRLRIYSANLRDVVEDDGEDFYKIEIWSDENLDVKVLKRYDR